MGRVSPEAGARNGRAPGRTWFRRRAKRASSRTAAWSRSARRARCAAATQPRLPGARAKNPERAAKAKAIRNVHRHRSPAASPASRTLRRCATSTTETPHPTALPPVYAASPTRKYRWRNARRARNAFGTTTSQPEAVTRARGMDVDGSVQILSVKVRPLGASRWGDSGLQTFPLPPLHAPASRPGTRTGAVVGKAGGWSAAGGGPRRAPHARALGGPEAPPRPPRPPAPPPSPRAAPPHTLAQNDS